MNFATSKSNLFETKVNVLLPLNIVGKSSFFDVAWLLDASLECVKLTL